MKESIIENELCIKSLIDEGYIYRKDIKNYNDIERNFWEHLERLNWDFSENEKKQIKEIMMLDFNNSSYKACIKNAFSKKYVEEGFTINLDNGEKRNIIFYDDKIHSNNIYEVANQISLKDDRKAEPNRLDVIGFVNGIPQWWGELKSTEQSIESAKNDVVNYHDHSLYGLLCYIVVIFVSNDIYTRYTVNNTEINKNMFFKWKDNSNNDVNRIKDFVSFFLKDNTLHDILTNCVFVKYGKIKNLTYKDPKINALKTVLSDKSVTNIILKGYQYRCYKASVDALINKKTNAVNWLQMGTGKTFISIMTFLALKRLGYVVVLLIDRRNLTTQAIREFASFDPALAGNFNTTEENLKNLEKGTCFITTIQSFASIVKNKNANENEICNDLIFLQDEVHRTQGAMRTNIIRAFPHAKWCGFTGTPKLIEYQISVNQKLTLDLFGIDHFTYEYKMINALEDSEITKIRFEQVPINISFAKNVEEMEEELLKTSSFDKNFVLSTDAFMQKIEEIEEDEFCLDGKIRELFYNPKRIMLIAENILQALPKKCCHDAITGRRPFVAQLMVSDVNTVNFYANAFKILQKKLGTNFKIAPIGTAGKSTAYCDPTNHEKEITATDIYKDWIDSYNDTFNLTGKYKIESGPSGYLRYEYDVVKRAEHGEIDLIISATKLTTGYDNPNENTVFIDRLFTEAGLLQAVNRATRLCKGKEFANVVCYAPGLQKILNNALELYNKNTDLSEHIIWAPYEEIVEEFTKNVNILLNVVGNSEALIEKENILSNDEKKEIIKAFYGMYKLYKILQSYVEYKYDEKTFGIEEEEIKRFKTIINQWHSSESTNSSIFADLDINFDIISDNFYVDIDAEYIRKLITSILTYETQEEKERRAEEIKELIISSKNEIIINRRPILLKQVEEILKCKTIEEFEEAFSRILDEMCENELSVFAKENNLNFDNFKALVENSLQYNNINTISEFVDEETKNNSSIIGLAKYNLKNKIQDFIKLFNTKYNSCY